MPAHDRERSWSEYWRFVGRFAWERTKASFGGRTFLVTTLTGVVAFIMRFWWAEGDAKLLELVASAITGIVAGSAVAVVVFLIHLTRAPWLLHEEKSGRARAAEATEQQLREQLKPGLEFVMQACCWPRPEIARVGVQSVGPQTVDNAFVYVSVPALQISEREASWDSTPSHQGLTVQDGLHYHTAPLVSVGDQPGQFFLHFSSGHQQIEPGEYELLLSATGQHIKAARARLVVVCGPQRAMTVRLEPRP